MKIPKLRIGSIDVDIPIVQGGMGVRVSLSSLAAAVAAEGGMGTISSIGLGDVEAAKEEYERISREALEREIRKAKSMTDGHIAVNFMGVLSNVNDLILATVREGVKTIVYGAGLPVKLPALVEDDSVNLVPIVSSVRVAEFILRSWDKRYNRTVDAFILEGPLAGGHLGFSEDQLHQPEKYSLDDLLPEILETVKAYEDRYGRKIPIVAAGGIYNGKDIARMLSLGASGVQMATRFVCTSECGVSQEFKQAYLDVKEEDIIIIKSPVGMPGRAIKNKCLSACKVSEARYCIAQALVNSYFGDVDHGLIFCGKNAYRVDKIITVKELISGLLAELEAA